MFYARFPKSGCTFDGAYENVHSLDIRKLIVERLEAFKMIKKTLMHAPVLKMSITDRLATVETDASAEHIGFFLQQILNGIRHPFE